LEAVNAAYYEFDEDRGMVERSLDLSSHELLQANAEMRGLVQTLREGHARLQKQNAVLMDLARTAQTPGTDVTVAMRPFTEASAHALGVERAGVWLFDPSWPTIQCVDLFERSANRHSAGMQLQVAAYPRYFEAVERERTIAAADSLMDARTAEFAPLYLRPLGIASNLDAAVWLGGRMVGLVCNEHVGSARSWTIEDEQFAGSVADMVSQALEAMERSKTEQQLETKLREVELLNKVMMGREERILELKDEIKQLRLQLGQAPVAVGNGGSST
jgi:GAF domain-containing protein